MANIIIEKMSSKIPFSKIPLNILPLRVFILKIFSLKVKQAHFNLNQRTHFSLEFTHFRSVYLTQNQLQPGLIPPTLNDLKLANENELILSKQECIPVGCVPAAR